VTQHPLAKETQNERNLHEQFGDGIMRAINFSVDIQKKPHPAGDRVVVTFDGKFLPYDWTAAEG
jgi:cyanate lyase